MWHNIHWAFLWVQKYKHTHTYHLGISLWSISQKLRKLPGLRKKQNKGRLFHRSRFWLNCPVTWAIWIIKSNGVKDIHWIKYIILCSQEAPKESSGFWRNVLLSVAENYSSFEKQLLAWHSHIVETKCLTMGDNCVIRIVLQKLGIVRTSKP